MIKKSVSIILAVLMLVSLIAVAPIVAQARALESIKGDENGSTGDCKWSLFTSSKTLIVTGEGRMEDYTKAAPWREFSERIENIIIDDGVEYIGKYAFRELPDLRYVYIASSVKEVGEASFFDCTSLRNVVMSDGTETIDTLAFENTGLKSISVPATVTSIGNYSLGYDENKENYSYIPVAGFTIKGEAGSAAQEYATKYGFTFLAADKAIDHLDLTVDKENFALDTEKKESDYDEVTEGIYENTGVDTEGCKTIGSDTCYLYYYDKETYTFEPVPFKDAENINPDKQYCILYIVGLNNGYDWTSAIKKYSGEYMDIRAMDSFSLSLNEDEFNDAFISYNSYNNTLSVLVSYDNFLTHKFDVEELSDGTLKITKYNGSDEDVLIPEEIGGKKVTVIGYQAFFGCHKTKYVMLPNTITTIEEKAFYYCGVDDIELNNGLEAIGDNAFCTNLGISSITVPPTVTTIGKGAIGTKVGSGYHPEKMDSCKIYGKKGSTAETYANENGFEFINIDSTSIFTLTYDVNGGTLTDMMPEALRKQVEETGKFTTQANGGDTLNFTKGTVSQQVIPPEGKDFDAFEINGFRVDFGVSVSVTGDTTIKFLYKDKGLPDNSNITFNLNGASVSNDLDNDTLKTQFNSKGTYTNSILTGSVISLTKEKLMGDTVVVPEGVELEAVEIGGKRYELGTEYKIVGDAEIKYIWNCGEIAEKCKVTFDFNGGKIKTSEFKNPIELPFGRNCHFTDELPMIIDAPSGKYLDYYTANGKKFEKDPNFYFVNEDTTIKLFWKDAPASGETGDCSWSFNKNTGTLTISGNGNMDNYEAYEAPWYPYKDDIKKVVIEEGVKNTGDFAFYDCASLTSVSLPSTHEKIGEGSFTNAGLKNITVPASVKEIGMYALGYNYDMLSHSITKVDGFTIYTEDGSAAADYAKDSDFTRKDTSETPAEPSKETPTKPEPSKETPAKSETSKKSSSSKQKAKKGKTANPIKVTVKAKTLKAKKLKKKKLTVKAITVKKAKGKITYKIIKKGTTAKIFKKISINKKGVITFKKGKYAKKTYKIKVQITAAGNSKYKKKSLSRVIKVKIK